MTKLKFTLRLWPVIALATIGLCYLTQTVADWFGVELSEQQNVELVRWYFSHAFDSGRHFASLLFVVAQIVILAPAIEECLFRFVSRLAWRRLALWIALCTVLSAAFSFVHYPDYPQLVKTHVLVLKPFDNAFLALFFFGFAQCWLYRKTGRLWCVILNHALFNLTNLALLPFV